MKININGIVDKKLAIVESGNFRKQTLVINNSDNKTYAIDFNYESIEWLSNVKRGSLVNVNCYIRTNENQGRYFTSIIATGIKVYQSTESYNSGTTETHSSEQDFNTKNNNPYADLPSVNANDAFNIADDDDDLPF